MKRVISSLILGVRNRHLLAFDLIMGCVIPAIALVLRVETMSEFRQYVSPLTTYTVVALIWKIGIFFPTGLYNRYWRYASVEELATIALGTLSAWAVGTIVFFGVLRPFDVLPYGFPRAVSIIDGLLTMLVVGGVRFSLRLGFDLNDRKTGRASKKPALIVGAGVAGSMIVKEMHSNPQLGLEPLGFVDDDPKKKGQRIHGVPVLGQIPELASLVGEHGIVEVIIAMPTAPGRVIRDVVQACKEARVVSKTIPGIFEILGGTAKVSQIRDVQIEDLLRRGVVKTDTEAVASLLRGTRVMVTGAGGSIGAEICRQISGFNPAELVLVGHGENSLFEFVSELQRQHSADGASIRTQTVVADMRDKERMRQVFHACRPQVIFHAAAHKHVGLMESNLPDAITNNVLGTKILVDLAVQYNVDHFVMISSDKAVNPTSVMGVTKRVAELIVGEAAERTWRAFVTVRFGNVLGSRGSVVPIFKQQIAMGGPVLITHPDVTRFFMTIPEAVQLVLQAAAMGEGGELFVLDMGAPMRILDLARDLIRLSGLEEGRDIDIAYSGLKPGEKMSEELFFGWEPLERSNHAKILVCRKNGFTSHLSCRNGVSLNANVKHLIAAAQRAEIGNVQSLLKIIVPEYQNGTPEPSPMGEPIHEKENPVGEVMVGK